MKYPVKISSIDTVMMILSIVPLTITPHIIEVLFKYIVTGYILLKYLSWDNIKRNVVVFSLIFLYTLILSYSSYINTSSYTWTLSAFMTGMQYLAMFILFYSITKRSEIDEITIVILKTLGVLIVLNDILMPVYRFHIGTSARYFLLGNKFSVSYLHCLFGTLFYILQKGKIKKKVFVIWFVYSIFISMVAKCTTGIVMAMAIIAFIWFPGILERIIDFSLTFPIAICAENILIWGSTNIFKQPWMQNIITGVFHKSADMTGRDRLYNITLKLVSEKPLWGYGHVTDIYKDLFGYGNAQNGLFHIVTQAGIIGAVIYFLMITLALKNKRKDNKMYGLYMFVYAMLIGSAVEINLAEIFLIAVAMIYAYQRCQNQNDL